MQKPFLLFAILLLVPPATARLAFAAEEPGTTTLALPQLAFTKADKPYAVLRRGDIEAVVVDNSAVDDDMLPGHKAGYSGLASLKHARHQENPFVDGGSPFTPDAGWKA
ncbi:MAG TPA: hypothetical protein VMV69_11205 [Pirellulales bacterium]|nr:hypothetical protein [Pirellulales bacterium]